MAKDQSKVSVPGENQKANQAGLAANLQSSRYKKNEYAKMSDGMVP